MPTADNTLTRLQGPAPSPMPSMFELSKLGYVEEEFLLRGAADSYRLVGERMADGRWTAERAEKAPFTTRLLVRRPIDPSRFSGVVVTEWLNVSGGLDAGPDWSLLHTHLLRRGHAWVGVSAQKVGIDGGGFVEGLPLKRLDPERYGILDHPGDAWSFDIFTRAGQALRDAQGGPVLGPLEPRRILAVGESQSATFLVTYVNAMDPHARIYDGFLIHGRPGRAATIEGAFQTGLSVNLDAAMRSLAAVGERVRADVRVPVLVLQSETDVVVLGGGHARQPDEGLVRLWEIAGAAHADTYLLVASASDDGRLAPEAKAALLQPISEVLGVRTGSPINAGPQQHYVGLAALEHLTRWADGGVAPPSAPRLELLADGRDFRRDRHGNAIGGLRTPWVDAPTAVLSGLGQTGDGFSILFGTTKPFDHAKLVRLYPGGVADYLARFTIGLDQAIAAGFILAEDRGDILALAKAAYPAKG